MSDLIKLSAFLRRYPDLVSEGSLRWAIFNRKENGIEKCGAVLKAPTGRWFVNVERFREWIAGAVG